MLSPWNSVRLRILLPSRWRVPPPSQREAFIYVFATYSKLTKQSLIARCRGRTLTTSLRSVSSVTSCHLPPRGRLKRLSAYPKQNLWNNLHYTSSVATRYLPIGQGLNDYIILSRAYETVFDGNPSVSPWLTPPFTQGRLKWSVTCVYSRGGATPPENIWYMNERAWGKMPLQVTPLR